MAGTVLVVDDSPTIRKVVVQQLNARGYDAITATDGAMAIGMLKQTIAECQQAGYIRPNADPDSLSLMLWAQVHGLVTLHNTDRLNIYPAEDKQAFLFKAYDDYMAFFRKSMA